MSEGLCSFRNSGCHFQGIVVARDEGSLLLLHTAVESQRNVWQIRHNVPFSFFVMFEEEEMALFKVVFHKLRIKKERAIFFSHSSEIRGFC